MTHIWVPKFKIITPKQEVISRHALSGWFKLEATNSKGHKRVLADWFPNLITNAGLEAIGTSASWLAACRVGTGSAAPSVLDTDLSAYLAGTSTRTSNTAGATSSAPYYGHRTITYRFAAGTATGNISEVGIASNAAAATGTLFSRALVVDGGGNPTTVTVLSDEVLDVTYQIRVYSPSTDVVGTINISGVDYDFTARAANATSSASWALSTTGATAGINVITGVGSVATAYSGPIGAVTTAPTGTQGASGSGTDIAYNPGTYQKDFTFTWGLSNGNVGGIRSVYTSMGTEGTFGAVQIQFDPVIPKNSTNVLELGFRQSWTRGTVT